MTLRASLTAARVLCIYAMRELPVVPTCRIPTGIALNPKSDRSSAQPVPQEGRFPIVTDVGSGMRWTRELRKTNASVTRTAKSCGSGAPTLALSWRDDPPMTVAKEPGHREEHEGNR